jgi:hypothetical protein
VGVWIWPGNEGAVVAVEAFFIPKALLTVVHHSYAPEGQLSTENTIWKSSIILVTQFVARDWTCGPNIIGNCIMTMPRLIHHTWSRVSWPNTAFQLFARLPTPPPPPERKSPWYPLDRRLGGPQSWSGCCGEKKNLALTVIKPRSSSLQPITIPNLMGDVFSQNNNLY